MNTLQKAIVDGLKECMRIILLALVSYLLTGGLDAILHAFLGTRITPEMLLVFTGVITTVLKSLDEFLHEQGKATNNQNLTMGITRF